MIMLLAVMCATLPAEETKAQGIYIPGSSGYVLGDTTRQVKVLGSFQGQPTSITVGVFYTKGASEDSTTTVQLLHSLDATAIAAGYGEVLSTDSLLQFANSAASEYQEQTLTVAGGVHYLGVKIVPVSTATDTTNVKPFIYVKE